MKTKKYFSAIILAALVAAMAGCQPPEKPTPNDNEGTIGMDSVVEDSTIVWDMTHAR